MQLVGGRSFPLKENSFFSQDAMRSDSCLLAAWLRLLTKKSFLGSCLTFLYVCELEEEELFSNVCPVIKRLS